MTARKHLKSLVRDRMAKTGERFAAARRQVIAQVAMEESKAQTAGSTGWHYPGVVAASTALRIVLTAAGIRNPATGKPFSEAMVFGIAGGIGAGLFTFQYGEFSSFYVAGRHLWQDDQAYFKNACARFGVTPTVRESSGVKPAAGHLTDALESGPAVAWVDMTLLPHRGVPKQYSGGGYHVVSVYSQDDDTVLIGDLTDEPIVVSRADFAAARERIKKQKNRLLSVTADKKQPPLSELVKAGIRACCDGMVKQRMKNFKLDSFAEWADRMHGHKGKESWDKLFPRDKLWRGLTSIHEYVEHYGTGGGLMRPLFAEFLTEAGKSTGNAKLGDLGTEYAAIGQAWSDLADAALPSEVPAFKKAKELFAQRTEVIAAGKSADEASAVWKQIEQLRGCMDGSGGAEFPLTEVEAAELRKSLQSRILAIHSRETAALAKLSELA